MSHALRQEVIVPHAKRAGTVKKVRSTLLASSRAALSERGLRERYESHLPPEMREVLVEATMAAQWLEIDLAVAHYEACDSLRLPREDLLELGDVVGGRIRGTLMGTMVRLAKSGGATPWTPLGRLDRIWARMYQGGSISVLRTGRKDALIEIANNPCADIGYWRVALSGLICGTTQAFARSAYIKLTPQARPGSVSYQLSWA